MTILKCEKLDISKISTTCQAFLYIIKIDDLSQNAEELIKTISDNSWISKLDVIPQRTYEECSKITIGKLLHIVNNQRANNTIADGFGEYMVSMNAQKTIETEFGHKHIPLAELWGKKTDGNPGFDFHTYDEKNQLITFGEAKYNSNNTALNDAVTQINHFIKDEPRKDRIDSVDLQALKIPDIPILKIQNGERNLAAAFSIVGKIDNFNIQNYFEKDYIKTLLQEKCEIYFIEVVL